MKQKTGRKLLGVLLALVIGLVPGMSLTAYADGSVKEVSTADGFKQYTIKATVKGGEIRAGGVELRWAPSVLQQQFQCGEG